MRLDIGSLPRGEPQRRAEDEVAGDGDHAGLGPERDGAAGHRHVDDRQPFIAGEHRERRIGCTQVERQDRPVSQADVDRLSTVRQRRRRARHPPRQHGVLEAAGRHRQHVQRRAVLVLRDGQHPAGGAPERHQPQAVDAPAVDRRAVYRVDRHQPLPGAADQVAPVGAQSQVGEVRRYPQALPYLPGGAAPIGQRSRRLVGQHRPFVAGTDREGDDAGPPFQPGLPIAGRRVQEPQAIEGGAADEQRSRGARQSQKQRSIVLRYAEQRAIPFPVPGRHPFAVRAAEREVGARQPGVRHERRRHAAGQRQRPPQRSVARIPHPQGPVGAGGDQQIAAAPRRQMGHRAPVTGVEPQPAGGDGAGRPHGLPVLRPGRRGHQRQERRRGGAANRRIGPRRCRPGRAQRCPARNRMSLSVTDIATRISTDTPIVWMR